MSPPNGLLSETREPIDAAINNCETNSDKSPPIGLLSEADCCPKTEYSDSDKSPLRTRVRLPFSLYCLCLALLIYRVKKFCMRSDMSHKEFKFFLFNVFLVILL